MKYTYDTESNCLVGPYMGEIDSSTAKVPVADYIDRYSDFYPFKTGILPTTGSGVISIQRALGFEQIIYQMEPSVNLVKWGDYENDSSAQYFNLAMPYHIIIADFKNNNFVGCRHFYSPYPIFHWDQQLYATNLPNTNTTGYRGTSIGWVCLYHTTDTRQMSFNDRLHYAIDRIHGVAEPYNNNNMDETDGPRFYQSRGTPAFLWDPYTWQTKTKNEGIDWACDPDIWVPIHSHNAEVSDHHQRYMNPSTTDSVPYTLALAANGPYSAYYHDHDYLKPFSQPLKMLDPVTLSSVFSGDVGLPAKPQKKVPVTAQDFAELVGEIKINPTLKMTNLAKGIKNWMCPYCEREYDHIEAAEVSMIYTSISVDPYISEIKYDLSATQERCSRCCEDAAYINGLDVYVDMDLTVWSSYWEESFLSDYCECCSYCDEPHPMGNGSTIWVYDKPGNSPIGCLACISEHVVDQSTGQNYCVESPHLMLVNEKALVINDDTGQPEYGHGPVYYTTQLNNTQHLCGAFYEIGKADGTPLDQILCTSCSHASQCAIVLNGTPVTSNTVSLI